MNDFTALNEAYDAMASSRMTTRQTIGFLSIDAHEHTFLQRPKGTIIIRPNREQVVPLRGGRSLVFWIERAGCNVRFEDNAGDLVNGELVPFPRKGVAKYTLSLLDDLDGPILDIR
jgi:hypothetical protein